MRLSSHRFQPSSPHSAIASGSAVAVAQICSAAQLMEYPAGAAPGELAARPTACNGCKVVRREAV